LPTIQKDTVLIFRLGSIGDTVVALPCFHAIARAFPRHRRVLLTNSLRSVRASSAESVLDGTGLIQEVIYYPAGFSIRLAVNLRREIRRLDPQLLIYLAERMRPAPVLRDLAFFKAAGIPRIVGVPWKRSLRACRLDPVTGELEYEAQRLARNLMPALLVSLSPDNWDLRLSAEERARVDALIDPAAGGKPLLAIAPGARLPAKDWGTSRWSALLKSLAAELHGVALLIVGAPDERSLCEDLARQWAGPVVNLCGLIPPREAAAALGRCHLMVCHDSGPMHLAAAQGTRCVALFGDYNRPRKWFPFGPGHHVLHDPRGVREICVEKVAGIVRSEFAGAGRAAVQECGAVTYFGSGDSVPQRVGVHFQQP
jgi:ADP-heptose:LPS heptosyltransferase